jgi:hypothetical protein
MGTVRVRHVSLRAVGIDFVRIAERRRGGDTADEHEAPDQESHGADAIGVDAIVALALSFPGILGTVETRVDMRGGGRGGVARGRQVAAQ